MVGFRAKAIIPLDRIWKVEKSKRYNMFNFGLIITTKDQEEIAFDFHTTESFNKCFDLLSDMIDTVPLSPGSELKQNAFQQVLNGIYQLDAHVDLDKMPKIRPTVELNCVKPRPMHITCVTIGTRGDVQPYVALCKGFIQDGHTCCIATHLEYKEWIEGFGIEFREVKGNPAELMQLCVEYGMFTVGFIKHAMANVIFIDLVSWLD